MENSLFKIISTYIAHIAQKKYGKVIIVKKRKAYRFRKRSRQKISIERKQEYAINKEPARVLVHELLVLYAKKYADLGIEIKPYKKVFIKNTISRWGSCSSKGNLNFSYRLVTIPLHLAKYIVAHELCHLREFNHSADFWNLVAQTIPDYEECKEELRKISLRNK